MRPIDADALIKILEPHSLRNGAVLGWHSGLIDAVIDEIRKMPTIGGWISVKDRLPEEKENPYTQDYQEVLCVLKTRFGTDVRVYKFGKGHFWNGPTEIDRMISHWMPFPELPKEESDV